MIKKNLEFREVCLARDRIREESKLEEYDWGYLYVYTDGRLRKLRIE